MTGVVNVTARQKVADTWGDMAPDWILVLADECDRTNQARAAERIKYSGGVVSQLLRNKADKYDLPKIEKMVRGALMGFTVDCPELQQIPLDQCLWEQVQPRSSASAQRNEIWTACRSGCPHFRGKGGDDAAL